MENPVQFSRAQYRSETMKRLLPVLLLLPALNASAQLPNGSTAPDFTLTDYYGGTHHR